MPNMSYCRFYNTLQDLRACYPAMGEELGIEEHAARTAMIKLCQDIVTDYGDDPDKLPHEEAGG